MELTYSKCPTCNRAICKIKSCADVLSKKLERDAEQLFGKEEWQDKSRGLDKFEKTIHEIGEELSGWRNDIVVETAFYKFRDWRREVKDSPHFTEGAKDLWAALNDAFIEHGA